MTAEQIRIRAKREAAKFDTAAKVRALLDAARKDVETEDIDPDEFESEVLELVTEE